MIDAPGLYDLSHAEYHADPVVVPSLSASIAYTLIEETPRHAWTAHPRFGNRREEVNNVANVGTIAHALILQGLDVAAVIDADSFRTKDAKAARDAALTAGKVPVLAPKWAEIREMVNAACDQLDAHAAVGGDISDADGKTEQTIIWQEGVSWCRCKPDVIVGARQTILDIKTTAGSANPEVWAKRAYEGGHDMRADFYMRGAAEVLGWTKPEYHFVVIEQSPPYALSVIAFPPAAMHMAARKTDTALELWHWCLSNDRWPGWPARIAYVDPPPWTERRWTERELREMSAKDRGEDLRTQMIDWQRPK